MNASTFFSLFILAFAGISQADDTTEKQQYTRMACRIHWVADAATKQEADPQSPTSGYSDWTTEKNAVTMVNFLKSQNYDSHYTLECNKNQHI
jgi:enterochelin esterase-like enzyme